MRMFSSKPSQSVFKKDEWLSSIMACEVFAVPAKFIEEDISSAVEAVEPGAFIYAKVPVLNLRRVHFLQSLGFEIVDTAVTFNVQLEGLDIKPVCNEIDFASQADEVGTVKVASESFMFSRFHQDPKISDALANRIKGEWVRNFFKGKRGNQMAVSRHDGQITGFLQVLFHDGAWVIDQIAVDKKFQCRGIAKDLIRFVALKNKERPTVIVGTQIGNTHSVNLYENMGFRLKEANFVLHKHFSGRKS